MKRKYSLSKQAFIISFGRTIHRLSALFAIMYLTRNLSKVDFGSYSKVWLLFNILVPIIAIGIPTSINYFIPLLKDNQRKCFVIQTYILLCMLGLLFSLIMFFGADSFSVLFKDSDPKLFKYFAIIPFLCLPTLFYQNLFVCLDNALLATKVTLFSSLTYLSAIIIPIYYGYTIPDMINVLTGHYLIQFLLVSFLIYRIFKNIDMECSLELFKKQIDYAIPIGLTLGVAVLFAYIDKIFISYFYNLEQFAEYNTGAMELPFITIITGSVMAVLMPEFVKLYNTNNTTALIKIWKSSIRKVAFMFFPLMCILFIFSEQIIIILFSEKYLESAEIFRIYLLQLPCRIALYGIVLMSINQTSFVLKSTLLCLGLNIYLNFILIKTLGVIGPAIATTISLYFLSYLQLDEISLHMKSSISRIFPWKYLSKILLISLFSGFIIYQFNTIILNNYLNIQSARHFIEILIGGGLYSVLFIWLCIITKTSDKKNILKYIKNVT